MWIAKKDGNVSFLEQWRLCCICKRMFSLNRESHVIGHCNGMLLHSHVECPPLKQELLEVDPK